MIPPHRAEEKLRKQVRLDMDGDLGNDPMLSQGLTLFLAKGTAEEQDDTPSPSTPMPEDSPQPSHQGPPALPHPYRGSQAYSPSLTIC